MDPSKRVVGYLTKMKHAVIIFRNGLLDYSHIPRMNYDWEYSVYGDVKEELPKDAPEILGKYIILTHYIDTNIYHDVLTRHASFCQSDPHSMVV